MSDNWIDRQEIREEQLIDGERERFEVELAKAALVARGTDAEHVSIVLSLETTSVGEALIALVAGLIIVEAFRLQMSLVTGAQVDAVEEAKQFVVISADGVILDDGLCCEREESDDEHAAFERKATYFRSREREPERVCIDSVR